MANKKVVFIILEGPSDESALAFQFDHFFDKEKVHIDVIHGDITAQDNNNYTNIIKKIYEEVKSQIEKNHYKKKDICSIIHIIDSDGVFIDDKRIIKNNSCKKTIYNFDCIETNDVEKIKKRNEQKKHILLRLFSTSVISDIPYNAFYMSVNLDHVLYNRSNLTDEEKENRAYLFAKKYKNDLDGFIKFINSKEIYDGENYQESCQYLQRNYNSLSRHSNLALLFNNKE